MKQASTKSNLPSALDTAILSVFFVLACAYVPLSFRFDLGDWGNSVCALSVTLLSVAILARISHSFHNVIGYAIILAILMFFGGNLTAISLFAAFASAVSSYAYLLLRRPSPIWWGLGAIAPVAVALITRSPAYAAAALLAVPCAIALAYSIKNSLPRVGAVCRIGASICVGAAAIFAIAFFTAYRSLSPELIRDFISALRSEVTITLSSAVDRIVSEMPQNIPLDLSAYTVTLVETAFNLLPAIVIVIGTVIAYMIHSLFIGIYFTTPEEKKAAIPMLTLDMSLASAIVFIAALILSLVLSQESGALYAAAAQNVMIVLAPGLILTALGALQALTSRKGPSCFGTLIYVGVVFMVLSFSLPAIVICSVAGAAVIIIAHVGHRGEKKNSNNK